MWTVSVCTASVAIVNLYYFWRRRDLERRKRDRNLRERVAHLLWAAAAVPEEAADLVGCRLDQRHA